MFSVQDIEERYFQNQKVEQRFKEIVHDVCVEQRIEILTIECDKDHTPICVTVQEPNQNESDIVIGVDLGLKVPDVAVTSNGKIKFFGNGRQNKYIRRKFKSKRCELGKAKKLNAIRRLNDKEQRWMKDQDHKISREVVDLAAENNVSVIRLEKLLISETRQEQAVKTKRTFIHGHSIV